MTVFIKKNQRAWSVEWWKGFFIATTYSLAFVLTPIYCMASVASFFLLPWRQALFFSGPLLLSCLLPPMYSPAVTRALSPMARGYFQYDEVLEYSYDDIRRDFEEQDPPARPFLLCMQPHGVLSFTSFCMGTVQPPYHARMKTAVATSLLYAPFLKQLLGINGLMSASKTSLTRHFQNKGIDGCAILYVGGIAEVFQCDYHQERLFLSNRKGFIKLALRENVDIVPAYLFGNTSIFSDVHNCNLLCTLSRKTGIVLTYFWGKWWLPIPRDDPLLCARGKRMGLPHIPHPTQADIDYWHAQYCAEVVRLFDAYKEKVPHYKNKTLHID